MNPQHRLLKEEFDISVNSLWFALSRTQWNLNVMPSNPAFYGPDKSCSLSHSEDTLRIKGLRLNPRGRREEIFKALLNTEDRCVCLSYWFTSPTYNLNSTAPVMRAACQRCFQTVSCSLSSLLQRGKQIFVHLPWSIRGLWGWGCDSSTAVHFFYCILYFFLYFTIPFTFCRGQKVGSWHLGRMKDFLNTMCWISGSERREIPLS